MGVFVGWGCGFDGISGYVICLFEGVILAVFLGLFGGMVR